MARLLDQILVIDVEATCWDGKIPEGMENEIIEIGICPFDVKSAEPLEKRSILVRPEKSTVSEFCTSLTHLTQEQVDGGISFKDACKILRSEYSGHRRVMASYGDYDRRQFERQCQSFNVGYPFGSTHLNIKNLFAVVSGLKHEVGMAGALEYLDLPLEGTHHRGVDDAWNIACILSVILKKTR